MKHPALNLARRALICATYLAFACRLAIPAGYMPAALSDGGPFSLCPMGLPAGLVAEHPAHHHDNDDDSSMDLLWEYCPVGTLTDAASIVPEVLVDVPVFRHARTPNLQPGIPVSVARLGFRSRAPPRFVI